MVVESLLKEAIRIAPKPGGEHWTVDDWEKINFETEDGWQEAIEIGKERLRMRYFVPIELFMCKSYTGFAVMALDCLLIETLQQFRDGRHETKGSSKSAFCHFLTRTSFREHFNSKTAEKFYLLIRCGIIHQAEIKGTSRIVTRPGIPLITEIEGGLVINRRLFHEKLVEVFDDYFDDLKNSNSNSETRNNFKKKMDAICKATKSTTEAA